MKNLIIVRHGYYDLLSDHLTDKGREQITSLSNRLKEMVAAGSVTILTSVMDRARESAEIIGQIFGVGIEEHEVLWSNHRRPANLSGALGLVRSKNEADTLILVTHGEYVEYFPKYFGEEELRASFSQESISKGTAWFIDCEAKTITFVQ